MLQVPSLFTHLFMQQALSTYCVPALHVLGGIAVESSEAYNKSGQGEWEGTQEFPRQREMCHDNM